MHLNKMMVVLCASLLAIAPAMAQNKKKVLTNGGISTPQLGTTPQNVPAVGTMEATTLGSTKEKVMLKPESVSIQVVPATWQTVTEQILVSEAHQEHAIMGTATEQILVKPSTNKIEVIPAVWQTTTKTIVTQTACGNNPQVTKTYTQVVLVKPETTRNIEVPAEYKTITKQVVQKPGSGKEIPAEYRTFTKSVLNAPDQIREIIIPADFQVFEVKTCK